MEHADQAAIPTSAEDVPDPRDAQAIQNLLQTYAFFADAGDVSGLASLFVADAVWDGNEMGYGAAAGPLPIAELVTAFYRSDQPMMHTPGPAALTRMGDDDVHSTCWCLATRWTGDTTIPYIHFHYFDVVHRGDDGRWRFSSRHLRPAFRTRGG
jgi:hypothetical protein